MYISLFEHFYRFPARQAPAWGAKVDRWYQLDAYAFGLCDGYDRIKMRLGKPADFVLLASPEASNRSDHVFAITGAISPSKFVHTLANVRSAPLFQVASWSGPSICIQNDPETEVTGLCEAVGLCEVDPSCKTVWVFTVAVDDLSLGSFRARIYRISREKPNSATLGDKIFLIEQAQLDLHQSSTDASWLQWSSENSIGKLSHFRLSPKLKALKCPFEAFRE